LRFHPIAFALILSGAACQACATQDRASRAAEKAAVESEEDASCQEKGAPDSPAYEACRKALAEARQRAIVQEQKRRDFDRVLGAGTEGQNNY
jgi:hypothetical protein